MSCHGDYISSNDQELKDNTKFESEKVDVISVFGFGF